MKTIYVNREGKRMMMEEPDIEVKIPILFRYYKTMDSFSLFIDPDPKQYKQMKKNLRKSPEHFEYASGFLICPTKEYSNMDAWEVEDLDKMNDEMQERLRHYWIGYTDYWFKNYCNENSNLWRGNETNLGTMFYLNDTIIPEANNCTFVLSGNYNGIRFSHLSNVLIHVLGDYYEVE